MLGSIIALLVYLFIITYLGYLGYRHTKTSADYLVGGRQIHPMIMALSYGSTFISTSAIVGFGGAAGTLGMGLLWLTFLNIFVGIFVAFVIFGKRTRKMGHNLDAHTFPELLGNRFNSKFMQGFVGMIIFLFMPIYAAAVLKGGSDFIQTHFGISYEVSLLFFAAVVAVYVWMGGLKGVMYTDAFQGVIMFVGMVFLLVFAYSKLGGVTEAHSQLGALFEKPEVQLQTEKLVKGGFNGWISMPVWGSPIWWSLVTTIVMGVGIGVLAQPQLVVRFMTVKSNRELNRAVLSGGIFILMMTGVAFIVGALSNVLFFNESGKIAIVAAGGNDKIIPAFIKQFVPSWYGIIFFLALIAAAMSTLSSQFHAMGTAIGRDVYEKALNQKGNSIFITKTGILVAILISVLLAYMANKLDASMQIIATGTALFFGLCAASFLPAYIATLYIRNISAKAVLSGIITGFVVGIIWIFFVHEKEASSLQLCQLLFGKPSIVKDTVLTKLAMVDPIIIALPASVIATLIGALVSKNKVSEEHLNTCFKGI
ncbi:MAG: sodium:solute symporter [Bacteroidetes bacterium GWF2_42_66]|nr:MAG: sodium:solute symporter [Bacteroidetes bacterium GWA2_42_15]OFX99705.1 MAG: sodium:solute symporter [Bacteroidetes bacterium GWE2_42_39]OFY39743.1 MAG: sodium:solute symporter [Bacteroidetes bacterium GWF2_42_66]HAZ02579.1 sodium:solute symporter [Marinilabiliales bacterium]HBL74840.1 sodium:solute symporter [Prolixibacteraceae bacterium]